MYKEKINNILDRIVPIAMELRELNNKIVKDILAIEPKKKTINVLYYVYNYDEVNRYYFLDTDDIDDYAYVTQIGSINASCKSRIILNMVDEDCEEYGCKDIEEFLTSDLYCIADLLNEILKIATKEGRVVSADMPWDE